MTGFYTPGLGRSATAEWTIEGGHLAERCQAFILIALGESIVIIGATLSGLLATTVSWAAIVVLGLLGFAAPALPALALGLCATVVVVGVAVTDYRVHGRA